MNIVAYKNNNGAQCTCCTKMKNRCLTSSHREYYIFFPEPSYRFIYSVNSEKISSPDNQINSSFIDISRIKWLVFFIAVVFLSAFQREIKDLVTMDINPSLQFLAGTSKAQLLDKGIRQKSTKRVNSFIACSALCTGPPNRDPRDSEKLWRVYTSIAMMAPVACLQVFWQNTQKSEWVCRRSPIGRPNKNLRVYTASDANWLNIHKDTC